MRSFFKISALVLLYFLSTAKSCDNSEQDNAMREEAQAASAKDSITDAFASDTLTSSALRAFEATARLKLYDLDDYLGILSDSTTSEVFKTKVGEMIAELFISRDIQIQLSYPGCRKSNANVLRQLRLSGFERIDLSPGIMFDSVCVGKQLQRVDDTLYSGKLRTWFQCAESVTTAGKAKHGEDKIIDIFVVKREKVFGNKSFKVWTVLLGDIK
jgi:hypothetical protein